MRERPIIFTGESVRAILAGTKTQTRRILKWDGLPEFPPTGRWGKAWQPTHIPGEWIGCNVEGTTIFARCPYGVPGDRLWVRETFQPFFRDAFIYLADAGTHRLNAHNEAAAKMSWPGWKPSRHMPRAASRLLLEVTEVRVQRLRSISTSDVDAEGIDYETSEDWHEGERLQGAGSPMSPERYAFACGWNRINGKRADWKSNPWVWAITFRVAS